MRSPDGAAPPPEDLRRPRTIAIDGPGASGKSVVGHRLADALGYLYFDTGALYRALTVLALESRMAADDAAGLARLVRAHRIDVLARPADTVGYAVLADGRDITRGLRAPEVDAIVSPVSSHAAVRELLLEEQRRVAREQAVVMTGRDIGTVVLPDADLKVFLDASPEARARRRLRERLARGEAADYASELSALDARDAGDRSRPAAPLAVASTAVIVNTDACDVAGVVAHLLRLVARWPDELTTRGGPAPCVPSEAHAEQ